MLTIPQNFTVDLSDFDSFAPSIGMGLGSGTTYKQYDGLAGFALRGLAFDATLTLPNGRRMAPVGMILSPTVSVIPSVRIERIDIISDGASAACGADAVNIVTCKPKDGVGMRARGVTATRTGSKNGEASALDRRLNGALVWGRGSFSPGSDAARGRRLHTGVGFLKNGSRAAIFGAKLYGQRFPARRRECVQPAPRASSLRFSASIRTHSPEPANDQSDADEKIWAA